MRRREICKPPKGYGARAINAQWQDFMAPFFEGAGDHADALMEELEPVFYLE